jgi:hypothetical protein
MLKARFSSRWTARLCSLLENVSQGKKALTVMVLWTLQRATLESNCEFSEGVILNPMLRLGITYLEKCC